METIKLPNGYAARIAIDDFPLNPWEDGWCEPPILVFNECRPTPYGDALELPDIFDLLPGETFTTRAGRRAIMRAAGIAPEDYAHVLRNAYPAPLPERARDAMRECLMDAPTSWRDAEEYFANMEALAAIAGLAYYSGVSSGYSQGDSARVFVALTDRWRKESGCTPDPELDRARGKAAFDLWSAWAWGDVYGVEEITRPDGEEVPVASCWGFFGRDHKASGLLDHCAGIVAFDRTRQAQESAAAHDAACREFAAAHDAACRDIVTV